MKRRNTKILIVILLLSLVLLGIVLFQKNLKKQSSLSDADEVTSQRLVDISSKIRTYYQTNKKLPESLEKIIRVADVKYTKQGDKIYQLCGDFNTQLKPLLDEYDAHDAPNAIGTINYHSNGTDCFKVTMD